MLKQRVCWCPTLRGWFVLIVVASMTLAGDYLYQPNQSGDVVVLKAAPKFEEVALNSVGEMSNSSLAIAGGEIFFRTHKSLWCFSNRVAPAN